MIGFRCIYCGQPVSAEDDLVGAKVECPACGHSVTVRQTRPSDRKRTEGQTNDEASDKNAGFWDGKSDQEIARWLETQTSGPGRRISLAAKRELSRSMARYDDLTLFALSFAFVLLYSINPEMRKELYLAGFLPQFGVTRALAMLGMVLCLVNIFVNHPKHELEKRLMLLFAVLATAGTGIYSGIVTLRGGIHWFIIFPAWNIVNCAVLLDAYKTGIVDTNSIIDERPGPLRVLLTIVSIAALLMLCDRVFDLHWAVTYSIAVSHTMTLLGVVQNIFTNRSTAVS